METSRLGFAGRYASLAEKGRFIANGVGDATGTLVTKDFDPFMNRTPRTDVDVAGDTGPLNIVKGKTVLVLADVENLTYGARDLGFKFSFQNLGLKLREVVASCEFHAFFSRLPGDDGRVRYFEERGWIAHPRDIVKVQTFKGEKVLANSDNMILLYTGFLVRLSPAQVVIIASGDGSMTCEIAKFLKSLPSPREVVTMSLAGSTSARLDCTQNPDIVDNIEIGLDCLHRYYHPERLQQTTRFFRGGRRCA
jgi:hypothetical protein